MDRVDAPVGPRRVRGAALDHRLDHRETPMSDDDVQIRGLDHDGRVGMPLDDERLGAHARVLFVGHPGHDHVATQFGRADRRSSDEGGRQSALRVEDPSTGDPSVAERHCGDRWAHRVEVTVEQQRPAAATAPAHGHHIVAARSWLAAVDLEPAVAAPVGHGVRHPGFAGCARHERGVDRVDARQVRGETHRMIERVEPHDLAVPRDAFVDLSLGLHADLAEADLAIARDCTGVDRSRIDDDSARVAVDEEMVHEQLQHPRTEPRSPSFGRGDHDVDAPHPVRVVGPQEVLVTVDTDLVELHEPDGLATVVHDAPANTLGGEGVRTELGADASQVEPLIAAHVPLEHAVVGEPLEQRRQVVVA